LNNLGGHGASECFLGHYSITDVTLVQIDEASSEIK